MPPPQRRDRVARRVEVGSGALAGAVGSSLGAAKLRDSYKEDYPARFARHASVTEHAASSIVPKAGRLARIVSDGRPGFIPLAVGTTAAATATGAKKYRKHREAMAKADTGYEMGSHPRYAQVRGVGRVRVVGYHGNGHFMVLDRSDSQRLVHRDQMTFARARKESRVAKVSPVMSRALERLAKADSRPDPTKGVLRAVSRTDAAVRAAKAKVLPNTVTMIGIADTQARKADEKVRAQIAKAFDPDRARRHRARVAEAGLAIGSAAAGDASRREQRDATGRWEASGVAEHSSRVSLQSARIHAGQVSENLGRHLRAVGADKTGGLPPTSTNLGHTFRMHQAEHRDLEFGLKQGARARTEAEAGAAALKRARNKGALSLALAGGALAARRRARNSH